jgi:FkbM family methyltransferase
MKKIGRKAFICFRKVIDSGKHCYRFFKMRKMLEEGPRQGIFIQIGAGAGDLDERASFRDGFSQIVKSLDRSLIDEIILIEPNQLNFPLLSKSWSDFQNVKIVNMAITPAKYGTSKCHIYWSHLDGPNFQTASIDPYHVLKHFPMQVIEDLEVAECDSISLDKFLEQHKNQHIKLLGLDIEGIDGEVILETNFQKYDIDLISFEYIHLGVHLEEVSTHLESCGFRFVGFGVDVNQFDYLYRNSIYI